MRDPRTGRVRRRVEIRPSDEWIEVPDATPTIIDEGTYLAVQKRLDDPERRRQGRRKFNYALSGRIRCSICGRARVGRTLQGEYRYYRCRRAFAGPRHDRCSSRYVRAGEIEEAVRREAARALSNPDVLLAEMRRVVKSQDGVTTAESDHAQIQAIDDQQQRLVRLYQWGEIDEVCFKSESQAVKARRGDLLERLERPTNGAGTAALPEPGELSAACSRVEQWVLGAEGDDLQLLMDALQITVEASTGKGKLNGIIPEYAPVCSDSDVCTMVTNSLSR